MIRGDARTGDLLIADADVHLGYPDDRGAGGPLVLGAGARLRSGTILYRGSVIGDRFSTGHHVVVREQCTVGDDVSIWTGTVVDYGVVLGDRVKIHSNCYISQYTVVEDDAFVAPGVTLANDLYPGMPESAAQMRGPLIGAGAQIGVGSTVLPYVRIGAGAVIGAGSVVTRDVPQGMIAYGNPAIARRPVPDKFAVVERLLAVSGQDRS